MLFSVVADISKRGDGALLALPFWEKPKAAAPLGKKLEALVKLPIVAKDFLGKEEESVLLYSGEEKEGRVLLFGLGKEEKVSVEVLRKAFAQVAKQCQKRKIQKINVLLPSVAELRKMTLEESLRGACEGILSVNYAWDEKSIEGDKKTLLTSVSLIGVLPKTLPIIKCFEDVAEAVYFSRDLINGNADIVTPQYLVAAAKGLSLKFPTIETTIFDKKQLEKEKMGLLLAVGRGAIHDPAFIIASYKGHPRAKDHTVLIGKGITFDTGGLNLKPTGSMETMRADMSGAAAVLGAIAAVAALQLKVNVTAVVATAENAIDAQSIKPGDVYRSYSGKTVEIGNTDAEGRLILADAISYTVKNLSPSRMIDLATLTGAVSIALGDDVAGVLSNDDKLVDKLLSSGEKTAELLWRLPLHPAYKEQLKSDIADLKNIGAGRAGGTILGGLFLEEFVDKIPWAHLDIGGTAFASKEREYLPKRGIGFGVRLLVDFLSTP